MYAIFIVLFEFVDCIKTISNKNDFVNLSMHVCVWLGQESRVKQESSQDYGLKPIVRVLKVSENP